jgi:hypothetical protein
VSLTPHDARRPPRWSAAGERPQETDDDALDESRFGSYTDGTVAWVLGNQRSRLALAPKALERRFSVEGRDYDLAVIRVLPLTDDDEIALDDASVRHAVTADAEGEIGPPNRPLCRYRDMPVDVLLGKDRNARDDPADDRHAGNGERLAAQSDLAMPRPRKLQVALASERP